MERLEKIALADKNAAVETKRDDEGHAKLFPLAVDELAGQTGRVLIENVLVQRPVHHCVDAYRETGQIFPMDGGLAAEGVARLHDAVVA